MADTCGLKGIDRCEYDALGLIGVTEKWLAVYSGSTITSVTSAHARAVAAGLPGVGSQYESTSLYRINVSGTPTPEHRNGWEWVVAYGSLPDDQSGLNQSQISNPLLRPATYDLERRETDFPIVEAKNVEPLPYAGGGASGRAAGTLGRVVNAAGEQADEQLLDTISNPVLVIRRNYASLNQIIELNLDYQLTTNDAAIYGWEIRRLKFLAAESLGRQEENGIEYYPGEVRIEVMKTTDLKLDNVGWHHWDVDETEEVGFIIETLELVRAQVVDKQTGQKVDAAAPVNLTMDGWLGSDEEPTSITYRYLTETDYSPLFA
jgi:hypothetical protein